MKVLVRALKDPLFPALLIVAYVVLDLISVEARRIAFPFDMFIWADSPFMTDMLKLTLGQPIYGPPEQANSFVYAPGLDLITYSLLRPFGLQLDVRACRAVVVTIGLGAALTASAAALSLRAPTPARVRWLEWLTGALLGWLVVSQNFTSDALHPDDLHMLHATACLTLTLRMMTTRSATTALVAAGVAGLGILTKQTEAASLGGVLVAVALTFGITSRTLFKAAAVGIGVAAVAAGLVFHNPNARFQLFTLLRHHAVDWSRAGEIADYVRITPRCPLLIALALVGIGLLLRAGRARFVLAWLLLGVTCALPNVLAYVKVMGAWNNLGIFDLWLFVPAWAGLVERKPTFSARVEIPLVVLLVTWLVRPVKVAPPDAYTAHFREIERRITADIASGKRVLVGHGTCFLIRAGVTSAPPLDRENSVLELATGGFTSETGTRARFEARTYDRLYLFNHWYPPEIQSAIEGRYVKEAVLESPGGGGGYREGYQGFGRVEIWTPGPETPDR